MACTPAKFLMKLWIFLLWGLAFKMAPAAAGDDVEKTRSVSVSSALRSKQPQSIPSLEYNIESSLELPASQIAQIVELARNSTAKYSAKVSIKDESAGSVELSKLLPPEQAALELEFDTQLVKICGRTSAERVKFLCITFMYLHTGAFGKHPVRFERKNEGVYVTAGPLKDVELPQTDRLIKTAALDRWFTESPPAK